MTETFRLTPRTPAEKLRNCADLLLRPRIDKQLRAGIAITLREIADELDSGTIPATPICGDVFQSGITDRAQGPCLKPPGHAPADPWHQDNTGCRWRLAEDAPLPTQATMSGGPADKAATSGDAADIAEERQ